MVLEDSLLRLCCSGDTAQVHYVDLLIYNGERLFILLVNREYLLLIYA